MARRGPFLLAACLLSPRTTEAFYLPGGSPKDFKQDDEMNVQVVQLTSIKTQIPFDFYSAPYCSKGKHTKEPENLGEVLMGDKIASSPYKFKMKQDIKCVLLCEVDLIQEEVDHFHYLIDKDYRVHMQLDNLPVAIAQTDPLGEDPARSTQDQPIPRRGFPVGYLRGEERHLVNHLSFIVRYNQPKQSDSYRIVGFEVMHKSIDYSPRDMAAGSGASMGEAGEEGGGGGDVGQRQRKMQEDRSRHRSLEEDGGMQTLSTCLDINNPADDIIPSLALRGPSKVWFTYDVQWREDVETTWANRWDKWLRNPESEIHYFSIVNSLMITLFLTGVVAMIMLRTLRKDISTYNEMQTLEDAQEESGWKLVHGDVFRPPLFSPMLLSILCGTGMQVFAMTLSTITFAFLGFLSPANRGGVLTALLVLFVLMGSFAGYWSATMYKFFNGKKWMRTTLATALMFPTLTFTIFWLIDLMMWSKRASTAVPVSTFVSLLFLWFFVSVPLVFVGSYFGFRAETYTIPVRVNQIARHVPEQMWYTHPAFAIALGGILPFGAVCIELFFIMSSLWLDQIYYVFSFLYVVFFILIATCAEITMVMCYFQLCNEDYRWWWRAFLSAGSSAGYLFVYSVWYYYSKTKIEGLVPSILYFGYMLVIALTFFLLTGSSGFFACFWFVRKIYSAIKVD